MRSELEDYFNKINNNVSRNISNQSIRNSRISNEFTLGDILEKAYISLDNTSNRTIRLRPDAKLFLYRNFDDFVLKPLSGSKLPRRALYEGIYQDAVHILQVANQLAFENQKNEISSHQILLAVASSWDSLRMLRSDSW